jgi:para-nitrobenzyl esterase
VSAAGISDPPVARTDTGLVRGTAADDVVAFTGIPYAAPPVGDLRFRPPAPVPSWTDVRDCTRYGPVAPQVWDPLEAYAYEPVSTVTALGMTEPVFLDEDCLYLNVWTPAADDASRPVMVFVHGGACVVGTASTDYYTGAHLAARDVVVVTFNYRLGVFGFLELGPVDERYRGSGNHGLLDQIAALDWVQRNIAAFGGDPGNVTVFGESAGSISICALLATDVPSTRFRRAIAQSGGPNLVHTAGFQDEVCGWVRVAATDLGIDDLLGATTEQLLTAGYVASLTNGAADAMFAPYVDGVVVVGAPYELLASGHAHGIDLLAGATQDEMGYWSRYDSRLRNYFVEPTDFGGPAPWLPEPLRAALDADLAPDSLDGVYARWVAEHDPPRGLRDDAATVALTQAHDFIMIVPMTRLAEAHLGSGATYLYRFAWHVPDELLESPEQAVGAIHALELPFVFGTLDLATSVPAGARVLADPVHAARARARSDSMMDAWVAFARTGDPNAPGRADWPSYERDRRATMVWADRLPGGPVAAVVEDPDAARRRAWNAHGFPLFGTPD